MPYRLPLYGDFAASIWLVLIIGLPAAGLLVLSVAVMVSISAETESASPSRPVTAPLRRWLVTSQSLILALFVSCAVLAGVPGVVKADRVADDIRGAKRHFDAGEILCRRGKLEKAVGEFVKAVELRPDDAWWHVRLAMALEDEGDNAQALEQFRLASQLRPGNSILRLLAQGRMGELGKKDEKAYGVGGDVTAPVAVFKPDPPYSEKARKAKYQGVVVLLVQVNAHGTVSSMRVVKPLGLDLDERALETVAAWEFKPGARNGIPVPVRVMVEVTFRLW